MTQHHLIVCLSTVGSGKWKFRKLKYPKCLWQRLREELILSYFYPRERRSSQNVVETPEDRVASRSSCLLPPRERPRTAVWRREGRWEWGRGWWWRGGGGVGWDRGGVVSVCSLYSHLFSSVIIAAPKSNSPLALLNISSAVIALKNSSESKNPSILESTDWNTLERVRSYKWMYL